MGSNRSCSLWPRHCHSQPQPDPNHVCDLHHSSRPRRILNPLSEARDRTCNLIVPSRIRFCCAPTGTLRFIYLVANIHGLFLPLAEWYSVSYVSVSQLFTIHPFVAIGLLSVWGYFKYSWQDPLCFHLSWLNAWEWNGCNRQSSSPSQESSVICPNPWSCGRRPL